MSFKKSLARVINTDIVRQIKIGITAKTAPLAGIIKRVASGSGQHRTIDGDAAKTLLVVRITEIAGDSQRLFWHHSLTQGACID